MSKTYKKRVKGHKRFDPRINKDVDVQEYDRNQEIKKYVSKKSSIPLSSKRQLLIKEIEELLNAGKIEVIQNLLTPENFLGSGEFSNAYLISDNLVLKINREESKYNPQFWKDVDFTKISKKEMKSEIDTYNKLKTNYSDILPDLMKGYEIKGKYFILRDFADIHIDPQQYIDKRKELIEQYPKINPKEFDKINLMFPKWVKHSISSKEYNKFTNRIFDLGKDIGYFDDLIQIAQRKSDKSLILIDLGHFKTKKESQFFERQKRNEKQELYDVYKMIEQRLKRLDEQVGRTHQYPKEVIDFQIDYYQHEIQERIDLNMELVSDLYKRSLKVWEKRKKEQEHQNVLDKELARHWKNTESERKRTHSGKMYEQYLKKIKKSEIL